MRLILHKGRTVIAAAAADHEVIVDYRGFSADFTHVEDVATAFARGGRIGPGQIYNVTQAFVDRGPLCRTMNSGGQDCLAG